MTGPNYFNTTGMLARSLRLPKRKCDWRQAGATKGSYEWQAVVPGIPNIVPGYGGIRKPREGDKKNREAGWVAAAGRSKRAEPDATHEPRASSRSVSNIGRWVSLLKRGCSAPLPFFLAPRRFEWVEGTGLIGLCAPKPRTARRGRRSGGTWNARPLQLRGLARAGRFLWVWRQMFFSGRPLDWAVGGKWSRARWTSGRELKIWLDFESGSQFACPRCGKFSRLAIATLATIHALARKRFITRKKSIP